MQYDAFGKQVSSSGTWVGAFKYGGPYGYQTDPDHGLKLLGHRYYEADTGRFLTRDPIKDGRNWYGYCENGPVNFADVDGEAPISIVTAIGQVVTGYTWHGLNQAIDRDGGRGVSVRAILDALKNPVKVKPYALDPTTTTYVGRSASVSVTAEGRIRTLFPKTRTAWRGAPGGPRGSGGAMGVFFAVACGMSATADGLREVLLYKKKVGLQIDASDGSSNTDADHALGVDPNYNEWDVSRM